ncbi:MAG: VOC family protein [Herpetosiphonaceae bacterium]|nr:VOC family protein [Herpetosiphonaceae bacterium]
MNVSLDGFAIHVQDVERSLEFYQRIPGAEVVTHRPGHIAIIRLGKNTLNLVKLNLQPPFHLEFEVEDVDALYAAFQAAGFPTEGQPENKPWGERTVYSKDPEGNHLEFSKRED